MQLTACSVSKPIAKTAESTILSDTLLATAHIGICVYDATDNKYLYNYQGNKYFIPASNTKIATCYAAMKYLGDSLVGLRYDSSSLGNSVYVWSTGDPTFLHPDFKNQRVYDFLKNYKSIGFINGAFFADEFVSDSVSKFKHYKLRLLELLAKAPPRSLQVCIDAVAKLPPFFLW